ncbi:MAG: 4Fe-4S dicluster domain-containing protein [Planctomycetota bacterium]|nr:4Fe-4S dicluster domain-containing protein [Nitrospirota bacterium]
MYNEFFDREKLKYCYQCGKCSSGCDINRIDVSFQPHRLLHLISIGAADNLMEDAGLWKCTTCFTCSERCPQGIKVTEILWIARTIAVKAGHIPELLITQKDILLRTGRLIPMDNKKRGKAGLTAIQEESSVVARIFEIVEKEK